MVKFEFILDDVDASNLIDILYSQKLQALDKAYEYENLIEKHNGNHAVACANRDWYRGHAEYLSGLVEKIIVGQIRVG